MSKPIIIRKKLSNGEMIETTAYSYPKDRFSTVESITQDTPSQDVLPSDVITRNTNKPL